MIKVLYKFGMIIIIGDFYMTLFLVYFNILALIGIFNDLEKLYPLHIQKKKSH